MQFSLYHSAWFCHVRAVDLAVPYWDLVTVPTPTSTPLTTTCSIPHHIPSDNDVLSVKYMLKICGLPVEIIDYTLDLAQYWPRTYEGSWTWFEATIIHGEPWWLSKVLARPIDLHRESSNLLEDEHTIVWPLTDEEIKLRSIKGLVGFLHKFVRLLEPGDRVALMARAMVLMPMGDCFDVYTSSLHEADSSGTLLLGCVGKYRGVELVINDDMALGVRFHTNGFET
ncbi:hypothetical protein DFS33DRAFT_1278188 [Desarmillaria ectypa]|nr:hypothetical protein DFS33DRAFT_1278188 [Desarmillaria ectypa]